MVNIDGQRLLVSIGELDGYTCDKCSIAEERDGVNGAGEYN